MPDEATEAADQATAQTVADNKFRIMTRCGTTWDVLFPGEMVQLVGSIKILGHWMSPAAYVGFHDIVWIARVWDNPPMGAGDNVFSLRPYNQAGTP